MLYRILFLLVALFLSFSARASFHQEASDVLKHFNCTTVAVDGYQFVVAGSGHHPHHRHRSRDKTRFLVNGSHGANSDHDTRQAEELAALPVLQHSAPHQDAEARQADLRAVAFVASRTLHLLPPRTPTGTLLKSVYLPSTRFV